MLKGMLRRVPEKTNGWVTRNQETYQRYPGNEIGWYLEDNLETMLN